MRAHAAVALLGVLLLVGGCGEDGEPAPTPEASAAQAQDDHAAEPADSAAGQTHDEHDAAAQDHAATDGALPLLQIMQKLGSDMASLTHGLMTDDHALVASSAAAIAEHAPIADLERIRQELGAELAEFERLDVQVHTTLVQLHDAATAGHTDEVLTKLNEAQRGCVACHAKFRERLSTRVATQP